MDKPEGKRDGKADDDGEWDNSVSGTGCVQLLAKGTPRHSIRVEGLYLLTRPDVGTLNVEEEFAMSRHDDLHENVVQDSANDRAEALDGEGDAWWKLGVLTHLQVTNQTTGLLNGVVTIESEVHVGLGVSGKDSSAEHLDEVLHVGRETSDGVDGDDKRQEDECDDQ